MTQTDAERNNRVKALSNYINRIEKLVEERKDINASIAHIKKMAVSEGFDRYTIDEMLKMKKVDSEQRKEREEFRDLYAHALGLI